MKFRYKADKNGLCACVSGIEKEVKMQANSNSGMSVIIPAYNASGYLKEAVRSVRSQNWEGGLEIIVVDDGSKDSTAADAMTLGCRVISTPNQGPAAARNEGLAASSGRLIFFLDADDVLAGGAFASLSAPMIGDPGMMAVFGKARDFISPDIPEGEAKKIRCREGSYGGRLTGCAILRREVFEEIGVFDASLKSGETVDFMMRLRASCLRVGNIPETVLLRRLHLTNMGRTDPGGEMANYAAILRRRMRQT
ncbi:MAG: glycosyltransferase family A protein [Lachnospiraceae bacterium]|nr:glycosyltransferase family A protein [Lachnospiraceae bacterium]